MVADVRIFTTYTHTDFMYADRKWKFCILCDMLNPKAGIYTRKQGLTRTRDQIICYVCNALRV